MDILAILVGVGVAAASPFVPVLRPVAKTAVAGGLVVVDAARKSAAVAAESWMDLISEAEAELAAEAEAKDATVETINIPIDIDADQ